ncbi:hypothetical protein BOTBODRAFT_26053 [Botryobasidium botryosum FD-172 SS1]|uniref:2-dehydropantoate 2-reductase n=1 Tax=Botryobasidium botryosum (strain FD-172 SS1) TaxID=930990 RepID=A0A067NBV7_BOTB1|nr:hypothetical protein BOTBODRAFT_26053 [Botryobasidium botryosum FD-172 SS1]
MQNCLIFGLGGIGSFYGSLIYRSGKARLSAAARSNYRTVKEKGVSITSPMFGDYHVQFEDVYNTSNPNSQSGSPKQFDYVVVATKALPNATPALPTLLEPFITPKLTTIALIQNGVGIEDQVAERWPENTIITCVAWASAMQVESGVIEHKDNASITLGLFENERVDTEIAQKRLRSFSNLLISGGGDVDVQENMQTARWKKVVWNSAWNALTTLSDLDTYAYLTSSPSAPATARAAMHEVITVAQALGLPIPFTLVEELMDRVGDRRINSSMQMDCRHKRPMEIEVILGTPLRKAKEHGIAVPVLETLYTLLTAIDKRNAELRSSKA